MLEEQAGEGVISFFSHGRAFGVQNPRRFVEEVMPKYFKQSKISSFQRQLNLYGFRRLTTGPDKGGKELGTLGVYCLYGRWMCSLHCFDGEQATIMSFS